MADSHCTEFKVSNIWWVEAQINICGVHKALNQDIGPEIRLGYIF